MVAPNRLVYGGRFDGYIFTPDLSTITVVNLGKPLRQQRILGLAFQRGKVYGISGEAQGRPRTFASNPQAGGFDLGNTIHARMGHVIKPTSRTNWRSSLIGPCRRLRMSSGVFMASVTHTHLAPLARRPLISPRAVARRTKREAVVITVLRVRAAASTTTPCAVAERPIVMMTSRNADYKIWLTAGVML